MRQINARLVLEDGSQFEGVGFGAEKNVMVELVFNTSMVGYQEILSDPSYTDQAVVMTYPLIGNYGINEEDYETGIPTICGMVVRDYNDSPSNFRSRDTLDHVMKKYGIVGISGVDTRKLTRHIRTYGSCKAMLIRKESTALLGTAAVEMLKTAELPKDPVSRVSTPVVYCVGNRSDHRFHVVVIDCGIKRNILRMLEQQGCFLTVVPWNTDAEHIMALRPDGVFISNGPGDPASVKETIAAIESLLGRIPICGICLGHQLICLAYRAETYKLKFGHRGGNHPVKNLLTDKIEMTSQNHSYAVDEKSLKNTELEITHVNLLDGTVEGVRCKKDYVSSVQYHPESAPGPQDSTYMFDEFLQMMSAWKEGKENARTK
ncbi:MAG: glutamine-hydrolyzing carbamoyl-phosphate synthase small subunit [Eubacteriales bacterium]|nr:glutamine-hydrolyzing carbamoyl-phosphate synthase small subunit [Eubacteriales bacterium]